MTLVRDALDDLLTKAGSPRLTFSAAPKLTRQYTATITGWCDLMRFTRGFPRIAAMGNAGNSNSNNSSNAGDRGKTRSNSNGGVCWSLSVVLTKAMMSSPRQISIGVSKLPGGSSSSPITWMLSWSSQAFTIRVPVVILVAAGKKGTKSSTTTVHNLALSSSIAQMLCASLILHVVQEVLWSLFCVDCPTRLKTGAGRKFGSTPIPDSEQHQQQREAEKRRLHQKARQEALNQQLLMSRSSKKRMDAERSKARDSNKKTGGGNGGGGLVITRAVYYLEKSRLEVDEKKFDDGGDSGVDKQGESLSSLDVTVPLQFWVSDSRLDLSAVPKANLLGFCRLSASTSTATDSNGIKTIGVGKGADSSSNGNGSNHSWWSGFWSKRRLATKQTRQQEHCDPLPKLAVEYEYCGTAYKVTIRDDEGLSLPIT